MIMRSPRRAPHEPRVRTVTLVAFTAIACAWAPAPFAIRGHAAARQAVAAEPGVHPVSGRRIASVMSHAGADWLDRPEREREEEPDRAVEALALKPGAVVADLGAGSGYFTVRLARRVGPSGRVFAADIQPEMLSLLRARIAREQLANVVVLQSAENDPRLPARSCDLILMVDVYHELAQPQVILGKLLASLKPDGRLVLVEYRKEDPAVPIRPEHKMSVAEARLELEASGFQLDRVIDTLPRQHILVFRPAR
jgi:ubiquinone/menaquinone biosynthesis C-methylase UbiE